MSRPRTSWTGRTAAALSLSLMAWGFGAGPALADEGTPAGDPATCSVATASDAPECPDTTVLPGTVTVIGEARVGRTLTGDPGTWTPADLEFSYRWTADGTEIEGATGLTLTLTPDLLGRQVGFVVTGGASGLASVEARSGSVTVAAGILTTGAPTISGSAVAGSTLTALGGTWSPGTTSLTYQWRRAGAAIPGATASAYTLTAADRGQGISVEVTGSAAGYDSASAVSPTVTVAKLFTTAPTPTIKGTAKAGSTLTATKGTWSPAATTTTYQWLRNGAAIKGATTSTYKPVTSDGGTKISVRVTGARAGYETTQQTSTAVTIAKSSFSKSPTPTIKGTARAGSTLTASVGTWSPAPTTKTFVWLRNGTAIKGATTSTYKLTTADRGQKITVRVTGSKAGFTSLAKTSAPVTVAKVFSTAATPKITGTAYIGRTLSVARGTWSPAPTTVKYQWYRNGAAIKGATRATYKLSTSDKGRKITVRVTGSRSGYETVSRTSAAVTAKSAPTSTNPGSGGSCPAAYPIKGNANSGIYHMPGQRFYKVTKAEQCFSTEAAAKAAGYRKAKV